MNYKTIVSFNLTIPTIPPSKNMSQILDARPKTIPGTPRRHAKSQLDLSRLIHNAKTLRKKRMKANPPP